MNKKRRLIKNLKSAGQWLINKERLGFYGFFMSFIIGVLSLLVGYWSFEASREALEISRYTSERDSITSIQMDNNRKNDSIANRRNNYRDSIQQHEMVKLLEKYNTLADGLLRTQMNAGNPQFLANIVSITDTVLKNDFEGKYRLPFIELYFDKFSTRPAYNAFVSYEFYFPTSNKKYFSKAYMDEQVVNNRLNGSIIPIVPIVDKEYFFISILIKWEDHLLENRIDSVNYTFIARALSSKSKKLAVSKIHNDADRGLYEKLKVSAEFVDYSETRFVNMIDVFYRQCLEKMRNDQLLKYRQTKL